MNGETDIYIKQLKQIQESTLVVNKLLVEIRKTKKILSSAKGWVTLDKFDGGLISSILVYNKLKKVQQCFLNISNLAESLQKELKDINVEGICFSPITNDYIVYVEDALSGMQVNIYISQTYNKVCALEKEIEEIVEDFKTSREKVKSLINSEID